MRKAVEEEGDVFDVEGHDVAAGEVAFDGDRAAVGVDGGFIRSSSSKATLKELRKRPAARASGVFTRFSMFRWRPIAARLAGVSD
ncbi:hypothetical protein AB5J72_06435 [Streptomyces sp. CG1]|uniref:hypothetical protein n=1 Tax=Streptomyces sp. CG1 TaxID=1287523 RepID=UPI0034E26B77